MPLTKPAYPPWALPVYQSRIRDYNLPHRWRRARAGGTEHLQPVDDLMKYEFIRMPDTTGFGDYTESGQVIPVVLNGVLGNYTRSMYLSDHLPIAGGRELWGFPEKLASPRLEHDVDTFLGTLDYSRTLLAVVTMGYKHRALQADAALTTLREPNFLLKIIPHVDGSARICDACTVLSGRCRRQRRLYQAGHA